MTQHKSLKRRVRARMAKTGERYTAARRQVVVKASIDQTVAALETKAAVGEGKSEPTLDAAAFSTSDESMHRATGRDHAEWFALLDAWGGRTHTHTEIAEWLSVTHGAPAWWRQAITVDYERSRGMRGRHQQRDGFTISVSKTVFVPAERALAAFTDEGIRERWLGDAPITPGTTKARLAARFDWSAPRSRIMVTVVPKGVAKAMVSVTHERLPDAESAERLKISWRGSLAALARLLEA